MVSINQAYPHSQLYSRLQVSGEYGFSIPKSPLRVETDVPDPRDKYRSPAADSVEFTQQPVWMNIQPTYSPQPGIGLSKLYDPAKQESGQDNGTEEGVDTLPGHDGGSRSAPGETEEAGEEEKKPGQATDAQGNPLDEEQQRELDELQNRDREVRAHEQAHKAVGGNHAGSISYDFEQGPDGQRYAVGGEVPIDVSEEKDHAATIAKMRQVRAAATAPADPSSQDRQVAAEASRIEAEARQKMQRENVEEAKGGGQAEAADRSGETGASAESQSGDEAVPAAASATSASGAGASSFSRLSAPTNRAYAMPGTSAYAYRPIDVYA